jgi:type IV pilus assembly protein PilM
VAKSVTTLYIDDASIRLMVSRGKRISKAADAPLDMDPAAVTDKVSEAEIVDKIKRLLKANKVGSKKVIVGLSGLHCLSRPAVLPQLPRTMLDEAVVREAKRVLPVPAEQLYVSWQVISATEGKMQAFMVAMPHEVADSLLRVLQQVGLKPYLMDIKPLALARLVPEATAILVDVQAKEFDIVIIADGIPQPIRTVPFSETALSLSDRFLAVRDELNRTVQFYNANNPQKLVQHDTTLYISGELAADSELSESLTEELGYRVIPLPSPMKCPKQINPAQYLVNIGLALKELPKEAGPLLPNINALPLPYQPRQISLTKLMALPAAAVAVGVVVLLVMTVQNAAASIYQVQSQLDATNAEKGPDGADLGAGAGAGEH